MHREHAQQPVAADGRADGKLFGTPAERPEGIAPQHGLACPASVPVGSAAGGCLAAPRTVRTGQSCLRTKQPRPTRVRPELGLKGFRV